MPEPTEHVSATEHNVTRRSFFQMAVGSLVVLPTVAGGYLIDTQTAFAEEPNGEYLQETDGGPVDATTTQIIKVKGYELGIHVVDAATEGRNPIAGARVRIVSRHNNKSVEGVTDKDGHVALVIRDLAEDPAGIGANNLNTFAFNGSLSVQRDGYREFETPLMRITGCGGIMVATHNLLEGEGYPYPRTVSFNGWDVLYNTDNTFITTPQNNVEQELSLEFRQMPNNSPVTVRLRDRDTGEVLQQRTVRPSDRILRTSFKKEFLLKGAADGLLTETQYDIELEQGDHHTLCPIQLSVEEGVLDGSEEYDDYTARPIDVTLASGNEAPITWHWDMPLLGGDALKGFGPDYNFDACIHPMGYFQLTPKTESFGYVDDDGLLAIPKDKGWGTQPLKFADRWWTRGCKVMSEGASRTKQGWVHQKNTWFADKTSGIIKPIEGLGPIRALTNLQLDAIAKWDETKGMFQGMGAGQLFVSAIQRLASDFSLGPVPVLISFDFNLSTVLSLNAGFYTNPAPRAAAGSICADPSRWKWDYSDTGMTLTLNLIPCLSVVAGIGGIGSTSARGRFQATTVYSVTSQSGLDSNASASGHLISGWAAQISLVISIFFFDSAFSLKNHPYAVWFDSRNLQSAVDETRGDWRRTLPNLKMADIINELKIIDDATMSRTNEFNGTLLSGHADGEEEVFDWETARKEDQVISLADGTPITYAVYSLKDSAGTDEAVSLRRPSSVAYEPASAGTVPADMAEGASPRSVTPKVSGVSRHGGIILHPDTDKIIAGNSSSDPGATPYVFGDPHVKAATISTTVDGTYVHATCSFRIGVVTIDGKTRSRIIMTVIDAQNGEGTTDEATKRLIGYSKPIDFEFTDLKGVSHADLYDYDYDIACTTTESSAGDLVDMVHLVVVSGRRSNGDSTGIVDAATNLVFSYVGFPAAEAFGNTTYLVRTVSAHTALGEGNHLDDRYHCISNVRIATDGTDESPILLIGMLDRSSDQMNAVLTDNYGDGTAGTVRTSVVFALLDQLEEEWLVPSRNDVEDAMDVSGIGNGTILGMSLSPKIQGAYTVTLASMTGTSFFVVKLDEQKAGFTSIKRASTIDASMSLVPWPQQDCFLTTFPDAEYLKELNESGSWKDPATWDRSRWMLQKAWWEEGTNDPSNPGSGAPTLHFEPIGPSNFSIDAFGINSSGTFIYWPQGREGDDGLVYHEDGSSEPVDEEETHLYQLMAARIHNGSFSDPFVAAEVDHSLSDLVVVPSSDSRAALEALSVEHIKSGADEEGNPVYLHHEANVWYTAVPHVACATVVDCYAPVPFVSAGGTLAFHVAVRNDGNCFLKGCTLQLCLHATSTGEDGKPVASTSATRVEDSVATLEIGEETLVESHFNPRNDATDKLENVEADFTLAPGKCSLYEVRVPIPEDWEEGDRYVSMVASVDAYEGMAEDGSLFTSSANDSVYQEFSVEPGQYRPYIQRSAPDANKDRTYMDVITIVAGAEYDNLADAPLTHWSESIGFDPPQTGSGKNPGKDSGKSSGNGSRSKGGQTSSGTKLPQTGDTLAGIAKGLAAAGAALTAFGIYSAQKEEDQQKGQ